MKLHTYIYLTLILYLNVSLSGQKDSLITLGLHKQISPYIIPASLITSGIILNKNHIKQSLQNRIIDHTNQYQSNIDDYIQYVPILQMCTANLCGVTSTNTTWGQTKNLLLSEGITSLIVHSLKKTLKIQRPDQSANTAMPSGHTSQAFVASQVLYQEYHKTSPILAWSGNIFSVATASWRVVNNKHWVPDVLVGAGIGILITKLVYHWDPLKHWNPFNKKTQLTTQINNDGLGFTFSQSF